MEMIKRQESEASRKLFIAGLDVATMEKVTLVNISRSMEKFQPEMGGFGGREITNDSVDSAKEIINENRRLGRKQVLVWMLGSNNMHWRGWLQYSHIFYFDHKIYSNFSSSQKNMGSFRLLEPHQIGF